MRLRSFLMYPAVPALLVLAVLVMGPLVTASPASAESSQYGILPHLGGTDTQPYAEPTPLLPDEPRGIFEEYDDDDRDDDHRRGRRRDRDGPVIIINPDYGNDRRYPDHRYPDHRYDDDGYGYRYDDPYGHRYDDDVYHPPFIRHQAVSCDIYGGLVHTRRGWVSYDPVSVILLPGESVPLSVRLHGARHPASVTISLDRSASHVEICAPNRCTGPLGSRIMIVRGLPNRIRIGGWMRDVTLHCHALPASRYYSGQVDYEPTGGGER